MKGSSAVHQGDYGWGYTGQSGDWIQEQVDLSPYAGDKIWVRFNYVTHYSPHKEGLLLDAISIPELGLVDPCEAVGNWHAEGFILAGTVLPARWLIQVMEVPSWDSELVQVQRMSLDAQQTGQLAVDLKDGRQTLLSVSALVRGIRQPLTYRYEIVYR